jgi:hypothetical protein
MDQIELLDKNVQTRLQAIYKHYLIKFVWPNVLYDRALERKDEFAVLRREFALIIQKLWENIYDVDYIEDTSFTAQTKYGKVWHHKSHKMDIVVPLKRPQIGLYLVRAVTQ